MADTQEMAIVDSNREHVRGLGHALKDLGFTDVSIDDYRNFSISFSTSSADERTPIGLFFYINKILANIGGDGLRFIGSALVSNNTVAHKYTLILDRSKRQPIDYTGRAREVFEKLPEKIQEYAREKRHH